MGGCGDEWVWSRPTGGHWPLATGKLARKESGREWTLAKSAKIAKPEQKITLAEHAEPAEKTVF
jgi:hypothetical protein